MLISPVVRDEIACTTSAVAKLACFRQKSRARFDCSQPFMKERALPSVHFPVLPASDDRHILVNVLMMLKCDIIEYNLCNWVLVKTSVDTCTIPE